jgi:NADH-quinone oxidoreductase subunit D
MLEAREFLYDLVEAITGARLTVTWCRLGGVMKDLPADMVDRTRVALKHIRGILADCDKLLSRNRIFVDRMVGIGVLPQEEAISWGLTGPLLRATGVPFDVRKAEPYLVYDRFDFTVPTGTRGDNYDRFMVRMAEMEQSMRILEQALRDIPSGPIMATDPRLVLPPKQEVYGSIEGLMNHFKLVIEGQKIPAGEVYVATEGGNGELGFYLVSDGSGRPYRVRVRPPSFYGMAALGPMLRGHMVADIITTFGQINMIGGECDH